MELTGSAITEHALVSLDRVRRPRSTCKHWLPGAFVWSIGIPIRQMAIATMIATTIALLFLLLFNSRSNN